MSGEWSHTPARLIDRPTYCDQCKRRVTTGIWKWYPSPLVSTTRVCDDCAEATSTTDPKEVTVSPITPELVSEVAMALEAAHLDWEQGRAASPDTTDYVLITERIVEDRLGPEYMWLSDEGTTLAGAITTRDTVAEQLYEAQCDGSTLNEWAEMAEWLIAAVTVGPEDES